MRNRKILLMICFMAFVLIFSVFNVRANEVVLRIYNWEDYISDGKDDEGNVDSEIADVIKEFEEYYYQKNNVELKVEYVTYATNEVMLSTLETGKSQYDLVCPSDYVIQKMIKRDMLEKLETPIENFETYGCPYIKELFSENGWDEYGVCYMWGTMGFLYDPEFVDEADVSSWEVMWNPKYQYKVTTKDSMRDTYVAGVAYTYLEELLELKEKYDNKEISDKIYNQQITAILNRCDDDTIALVGDALSAMKINIFGFEVDSGKTDITTGKIHINFAWSGDAVYAMDIAESDADKELKYSVPVEGSNVWFDAWVMPKGANVKLAQEFMEFVCLPSIAVKNMEKIGYTSAIAGDDVFEMVLDWYSDEEGEYEVDLTYLFEGTLSEEYLTNGRAIVKTNTIGRQFSAQYPEYDIVKRCAIMQDFGDQNNSVMVMWQEFKSESVYFGGLILLILAVILYISYQIYNFSQKRVRNKRLNQKKA